MKNLYITLGLVLATMAVSAQTKETKRADKLYAKLDYIDAAKEYEKLEATPYVYKQIAESYYNIFDSKNAVTWYAKATATQQEADIYYHYAQMLKAEGKYEEANVQMKKFASLAPQDQRAVVFNQDPNYLPKLKSQPKLYDEKVLDINDDKYGSFGGVLANDNSFYFTSTRNTARKKYGTNEQPFLDLYTSTYNANGTFSEPTPVSDLNTKWHDGPAALSADGKTMYFNSESFNEKKQFERDKAMNLKLGQVFLYKSVKEGDKWGEPKLLSFNDKRWSSKNASISKDGKTLYFASDREGTMGGFDIWKVEVKADNSYGEPVNLGNKVNTGGNEDFPFIADDNRLFFSSDRPNGFGALDVFVIDFTKGGDAKNVGAPVNTAKDDFAFSFNATKNIGFFSSNRTGVDKLYLATPVCGVEAIVIVKDAKTGRILSGATVSILDDKNNVIEKTTAGPDGKVTYNVDCNRAYTVQASMQGYENNSFPIAKTNGGTVNVDANLTPIEVPITTPVIVLNEIYFEFNKSNITREAAFELDKAVETMKVNPSIVVMVKAHTDSRGTDKYNMALSNRRAKSTVQYIISKGISKDRISGQGYGESEPKVKCGDNCTEEEHKENRRSEFLIVKK
ncbi:OmpA family protein [Flavobacterium sp. DG1-102-2]|uniref:OmpA family protein n=1 Tax=Flavobacterium sp. DG1-102-2 TaxID=3081663 RepID=UPI002949D5FD|nr:OmpA family protein [Flavobacterium sp. DG1-102-2]MDV6167801.1 OmpA family protein [Flavobacterium sp. DG1-102-2]